MLIVSWSVVIFVFRQLFKIYVTQPHASAVVLSETPPTLPLCCTPCLPNRACTGRYMTPNLRYPYLYGLPSQCMNLTYAQILFLCSLVGRFSIDKLMAAAEHEWESLKLSAWLGKSN